MTLIVIVLGVVIFAAGMLLGVQMARRKMLRGQQERLARAWHEGYQAAAAYLSPRASPTSDAASAAGRSSRTEPDGETAPEPTVHPPGPAPIPDAVAPSSDSWPTQSGAVADYAPEPAPAPRPALDPEARQLRNVNIALYVAAGLLIGAGLLFISFPLHAAAKLVALVVVVALFYGGGLVIHARSMDLRAAASGLTSIGLALIPVLGAAAYFLLEIDAGLAWMMTSATGTVAFVFASARLRSRIVAALAVTFFVSLAWSGGSVLNRGLIWYFVFTMLAATAISAAGILRPGLIGGIYTRTFIVAHRFLVPGVLAAAAVASVDLTTRELVLIGASASVYYGVFAVLGGGARRALHISMFRLVASLTVLLLVYEISQQTSAVAWALLALALGHLLLVATLPALHGRLYSARTRNIEMWGFAALAVPAAAATAPAWTGAPGQTQVLGAGIAVAVVGVGAAGIAARRVFAPVLLGLGLTAFVSGAVDDSFVVQPWRVAVTCLLALGFSEGGRRRVLSHPVSDVRAAGAGWLAVIHLLLVPPLAGLCLIAVPGFSGVGAAAAQDGGHGQMVLFLFGASLGWLTLSLIPLLRLATLVSPGASGVRVRVLRAAALAGASAAALLLSMAGPEAAWLWLPVERLLWWIVVVAALAASIRVALADRSARRGLGEAVTAGAWLLALFVAAARPQWSDREWTFEFLLGIGLAYALTLTLVSRSAAARAVYAIAAQVLLTWLALQLAGRFDADGHARVAIAASTLAGGQTARLVLRRRDGQSVAIGARRSMSWATLGILGAVPLAYIVFLADSSTGRFIAHPQATHGVDQASLLVQLACLGGFAAAWARNGLTTGAAAWCRIVPGLAMGVGLLTGSGALGLRHGGWLPVALWSRPGAALALAAAVVGCAVIADLVSKRGSRAALTARSLAPAVLAAVLSAFGLYAAAGEHSAFAGLVLAATALGAVRLSLTWARPAGLGASVLLAAASIQALLEDALTSVDGAMPAVIDGDSFQVGLWASAFFVAGWLWWGLGAAGGRDGWVGRAAADWFRRGGLVAVTVGALLVQGTGPVMVVTGCVLGAAAVVLAVGEWPAGARRVPAHAAALVVTAYGVRAWHELADPSVFWTLQPFVVALVALAVGEYLLGARSGGQRPTRRSFGRAYLLGAVALLTCSAPIAVVADGGWAQLWVLVGFVGAVVAGLVLGDRVLSWWGAGGVAAALAWYLRDYSFLLLALLALVLIVFALLTVRRLNRDRRRDAAERDDAAV